MSFEKVVIQKKLDDGSYIEDYPRTSQEMILNLLNSSTKSLMGLEESATADDAFKQLYLANVLNGKSIVELTFLDSETNKPLSGIVVSCDKFCDAAGTALTEHTTDSNGKIVAFVSAINPTIKVTGYADIENFSQQLDVPVLGKQFVFNFQLATNQFKSYLSSKNIKFSKNVLRVDVSCCGGGGGGASGSSKGTSYGGGGGGHGTQKDNIIPESDVLYPIVVGSGGTCAYEDDAGKRGKSSFMTISALGGDGGKTQYHSRSAANGNGKGGYAISASWPPQFFSGGEGIEKIYESFTSEKVCGGGGAAYLYYDEDSAYNDYSSSGNPDGGNKNKVPSKGIGGGGSGLYSQVRGGQSGGSGSVAIRMYLKSRS